MKNLFSNRLVAALVLTTALCAAPVAQAGLNVPYTVDGNTLHLWHFDDPVSGNVETDAVLSSSITLTNFGYPTGGPLYTNIFLTDSSATTNLVDSLQILPDDGNAALGASHAMAAGPVDIAPTNFCNVDSGAFTFEALVNPQGNIFSSAAGSGEWEILCGDNSVGTRSWQFRLQNAAAPVMDFNFINASGGTGGNFTAVLPTSGPDALATNHWYHVAVTYTGNTPTNTDTPGVLTFYWTLLDPTRTNADVLFTTTISGPGTLGGTPSPAVGGSQRTTHGIGNGGSFQGMIDEVRVSAIAQSPTNMAFNTTVVGLKPTFVQEPPAATFIGYGQTLSLNTLVSGSPAPSLQWQQTNSSAGGWSNLTGQTNNDLVISNATFAAGGQYRLVASNSIQNFSYVTNSSVSTVTIGAAFSEVFNTGTDSHGLVNTNLAGTVDLHYTLADSADADNPGPATEVWDMTSYPIAAESGGFANIDGVSQWIGPTWNNGGATYTSPQGTYLYRTHFLADAVDTTQPAAIRGTWWANTTGANILLNGESLNIDTGVTNGGTVSALFVITNGFVPGLNTLDFVVPCVNPNGSYPESALRVEISSALGQALPAGPPQIVTEPATNETVTDASVEVGTSASFSVVAIGRPPLSYQWVETNSGPIAGATNRTLTFASPTAGAQGTNFVVIVTNPSGSVTSSVATLSVIESAQLPIAPDVSYSVYTNNSLDIDMSELLLGSSDPNSFSMTITWDPATTNGVTLAQNVANGSILTYTPNPGFVGYDEFNYYISDADGEQATGKVLIDALPPLLPTTVQATHVGNNFVFGGSGGAPHGSYVILGTTDLTLPLSSWTTVATGNFDSGGGFSVSLPISAANSGQYYTIELP